MNAPPHPHHVRILRVARRAARKAAVALTVFCLPSAMAGSLEAAAGALDPTFGTDGKVIVDFFGDYDQANAVAGQPDGKLVVVGLAGRPGAEPDFALVRLHGDGSVDPSFGDGGTVTTDFAGGHDVAVDLALLPDGKILVVGQACDQNLDACHSALARYHTDGRLDAGFGDGGKAIAIIGDGGNASAVVLQPDGKIVIAGLAAKSRPGQDFPQDMALARLHPDGRLDASFGDGGMVTTDFFGGSSDGASAVALQPDGKIVVAGGVVARRASDSKFYSDFALARYHSDGRLDAGFGDGGKVTADLGDSEGASALVLQPDGKLVVAGRSDADFALARLHADGRLDADFGAGGRVTTDFGFYLEGAFAVALQPDGRLVLAGGGFKAPPTVPQPAPADFALARLHPDGRPDASFGAGGKLTTDFLGSHDLALGLTLQPDGGLVAVGVAEGGGGDGDFAVARYRAGSPPQDRVCVVQILAGGEVVGVLRHNRFNIAVLVPGDNHLNVPVRCQDLEALALAMANQEPFAVNAHVTVFSQDGAALCSRGPFTLGEHGGREVVLGSDCAAEPVTAARR
jgi:uncharacterized delta-60 repeat protein